MAVVQQDYSTNRQADRQHTVQQTSVRQTRTPEPNAQQPSTQPIHTSPPDRQQPMGTTGYTDDHRRTDRLFIRARSRTYEEALNRRDAAQRVAAPDRQPSLRVFLSLLLKTVQHPLLLLAGFWLFSLLIAGIALTDIIKTDTADVQSPTTAMFSRVKSSSATKVVAQAQTFRREQPEEPNVSLIQPASPVVLSAPLPDKEEESLPFVSLIAIALSCAAGSFLIARGCRPRQPIKRMQSSNSRALS